MGVEYTAVCWDCLKCVEMNKWYIQQYISTEDLENLTMSELGKFLKMLESKEMAYPHLNLLFIAFQRFHNGHRIEVLSEYETNWEMNFSTYRNPRREWIYKMPDGRLITYQWPEVLEEKET